MNAIFYWWGQLKIPVVFTTKAAPPPDLVVTTKITKMLKSTQNYYKLLKTTENLLKTTKYTQNLLKTTKNY